MSWFAGTSSLTRTTATARGATVARLATVALGAATMLLISQLSEAADLKSKVDGYRTQHEAAIVGQLDELTRLKSVAADPAGLRAMADRLQELLKQRGFEASQLGSASGAPPAVLGILKSTGAKRTVIFYAHYDGQPVTPSQWSSDPFVPVMRSGALNSGEHEIDWKNARGPFDPE